METPTDTDLLKPLKKQEALVTGASSGIDEACALAPRRGGIRRVNYASNA